MEAAKPPQQNITWDWRTAALLALCSVPAIVLSTHNSSTLGLVALLGLLPAAFAGVAPARRGRVAILIFGLILALSLLLGTTIKIYLGAVSAALFMAGLSAAAALLAAREKGSPLGMLLAVPVIGIGLSFGQIEVPLEFCVAILAGSVLSFALSLLFPKYQQAAAAEPGKLTSQQARRYAVFYALAIGAATLCGFYLDHTGWIVGSTAFVIRPSGELQKSRSLWRMLSVLAGVCVVSLVMFAEPGILTATVLSVVALIGLGGLHNSRLHITPAFTTFILFSMLLFISPEGDNLWRLLLERLLWVGIGIAIAAIFTLILPRITTRIADKTKRRQA